MIAHHHNKIFTIIKISILIFVISCFMYASNNHPIILIHGLKDDVVSRKTPEKIMKKISSNKIKIIYLKNSDHRLSKKEDLKMIKQSIELIR